MTTEEFLASLPKTLTMYPDPLLLQPCQPIEDLSPWQSIGIHMFNLMKIYNGCGLAAPQVGLPYRAFVLGTTKNHLVIINPEVLEVSDRTSTEKEGCLSIPGFVAEVTRPRKIKARWKNAIGKEQIQTFEGWTSRAFQHELDHLEGVLIKKGS